MKLIDRKLLTWLSSQAAANPRLRQNFNIHDSHDEAYQRLLNAVEPGSYIRPHCHLNRIYWPHPYFNRDKGDAGDIGRVKDVGFLEGLNLFAAVRIYENLLGRKPWLFGVNHRP